MILSQTCIFLFFPFNFTVRYIVFYRIDLDIRDYIRIYSKSVREWAFFIWYDLCYFLSRVTLLNIWSTFPNWFLIN